MLINTYHEVHANTIFTCERTIIVSEIESRNTRVEIRFGTWLDIHIFIF